jgi:hypothetical protein
VSWGCPGLQPAAIEAFVMAGLRPGHPLFIALTSKDVDARDTWREDALRAVARA